MTPEAAKLKQEVLDRVDDIITAEPNNPKTDRVLRQECFDAAVLAGDYNWSDSEAARVELGL